MHKKATRFEIVNTLFLKLKGFFIKIWSNKFWAKIFFRGLTKYFQFFHTLFQRFVLFSSLGYSGRIQIFDLETLQQRRLIIDLVECFQIVKGIHCDPLYAGLFELGTRHGLSRRGPSFCANILLPLKLLVGIFSIERKNCRTFCLNSWNFLFIKV